MQKLAQAQKPGTSARHRHADTRTAPAVLLGSLATTDKVYGQILTSPHQIKIQANCKK